MPTLTWLPDGAHNARDFRISQLDARPITGAVWLPDAVNNNTPLLLCGHGASGDRYQAPIPHLAKRFTQESQGAVLALDGPVHGLRQVGPGGREALAAEMQRKSMIDDMVADWHTALGVITGDTGVTTNHVAYFGLSMGSMFGIPLLATLPDVTVATIGLLGTRGAAAGLADRLLADARQVRLPLLFLMQLEDELFDRQGYLELFDALPSDNKRLHANPGLHPEIPAEEIAFAVDFLAAHLRGKVPKRIINPLAD